MFCRPRYGPNAVLLKAIGLWAIGSQPITTLYHDMTIYVQPENRTSACMPVFLQQMAPTAEITFNRGRINGRAPLHKTRIGWQGQISRLIVLVRVGEIPSGFKTANMDRLACAISLFPKVYGPRLQFIFSFFHI